MTTPLICRHCGNIWEVKGRAVVSNYGTVNWIKTRGNIVKCSDCGKADKLEILKGMGPYGQDTAR